MTKKTDQLVTYIFVHARRVKILKLFDKFFFVWIYFWCLNQNKVFILIQIKLDFNCLLMFVWSRKIWQMRHLQPAYVNLRLSRAHSGLFISILWGSSFKSRIWKSREEDILCRTYSNPCFHIIDMILCLCIILYPYFKENIQKFC